MTQSNKNTPRPTTCGSSLWSSCVRTLLVNVKVTRLETKSAAEVRDDLSLRPLRYHYIEFDRYIRSTDYFVRPTPIIVSQIWLWRYFRNFQNSEKDSEIQTVTALGCSFMVRMQGIYKARRYVLRLGAGYSSKGIYFPSRALASARHEKAFECCPQ